MDASSEYSATTPNRGATLRPLRLNAHARVFAVNSPWEQETESVSESHDESGDEKASQESASAGHGERADSDVPISESWEKKLTTRSPVRPLAARALPRTAYGVSLAAKASAAAMADDDPSPRHRSPASSIASDAKAAPAESPAPRLAGQKRRAAAMEAEAAHAEDASAASAAAWESPAVTVKHTEGFDFKALALLCTAKFAAGNGIDTQTADMLRKYRKLSKYGRATATIEYVLGKAGAGYGAGRLNAKGGVGIQCMPQRVRGFLLPKGADGKPDVYDLDMCNAQPAFLLGWAKQFGWACPCLEDYCSNRESVLADLMERNGWTRGEAKENMLKPLFCGPADGLDPAYVAELGALRRNLLKQFPDGLKQMERSKSTNKEGGAAAWILQTEERHCLMVLCNELARRKRTVTTLIHDGLHVKKIAGEDEFPPELLLACEDALLRERKLAMKLAVKPIETDIVMPAEQRSAEEIALAAFVEKYNPVMVRTPQHYEEGAIDGSGNREPFKRQEFLHIHEHETYEVVEPSGRVKRVPVAVAWLQSGQKQIVDHHVFAPPPRSVPLNCDNRFTGFAFESLPEFPRSKLAEVEERVARVLWHFNHIIAASDAASANFLQNYNAHMIQFPGELPGVGILLRSREEGAGKDTAVILLKHIIGDPLCVNFASVSDLLHPFAFDRACKIVVQLEEISAVDREQNSNLVKHFLTSSTLRTQRKGIDFAAFDNCSRVVATTNEHHLLPKSDRRWVFLEVSQSKVGDADYFVGLNEAVDDPRVWKLMGERFKAVNLSLGAQHWHPRSNIPMTDYKRAMIEAGLSLELQWLVDSLAERRTSVISERNRAWAPQADVERLDKTEALERFKAWATLNGYKTSADKATSHWLTRALNDLKLDGFRCKGGDERVSEFDWEKLSVSVAAASQPREIKATSQFIPRMIDNVRMFWTGSYAKAADEPAERTAFYEAAAMSPVSAAEGAGAGGAGGGD